MSIPVCDHSSGLRSVSTSVDFTCVQENSQRNLLVGELERNFTLLLLSVSFLQRACFIFLKTFLTWTIFTVFTEFVKYCFCFTLLALWPQGKWDLGSLIRDQTCTPCTGK